MDKQTHAQMSRILWHVLAHKFVNVYSSDEDMRDNFTMFNNMYNYSCT